MALGVTTSPPSRQFLAHCRECICMAVLLSSSSEDMFAAHDDLVFCEFMAWASQQGWGQIGGLRNSEDELTSKSHTLNTVCKTALYL